MQRRNTDDWVQTESSGRVTPKNWPCVCGRLWRNCKGRGARDFRGNPALVTPHDQWFSENLPRGKDGTVKMDGDVAVRRFAVGSGDPWGLIIDFEIKCFGATPGTATRLTLEARNKGRVLGATLMTFVGGNTPGPLLHYPVTHPDLHVPEAPVVCEYPIVIAVPMECGMENTATVPSAEALADLLSGSFYDLAEFVTSVLDLDHGD